MIDDLMRQMTVLPKAGTPAVDLTERDKVAIGLAAGVPYTLDMSGGYMTVTLKRKIGVVDRGDGGWVVGIARD